MKRISFITVLLFGLSIATQAQLETVLYYTPTTIINGDNTFGLEFGSLQFPRSKFMLTTKIRKGFVNRFDRFSVPNNDFSESFTTDEIFRLGFRFDHRIHLIPAEDREKSSTFFSYGLGYSRTAIDFIEDEKIFVQDDLVDLVSRDYNYNINSAEAISLIGQHFYIGEKVILELFGGVRFKLSNSSSDAPVQLRDFRSGFLAPEYSGVSPVLGARVGFYLTKLTVE